MINNKFVNVNGVLIKANKTVRQIEAQKHKVYENFNAITIRLMHQAWERGGRIIDSPDLSEQYDTDKRRYQIIVSTENEVGMYNFLEAPLDCDCNISVGELYEIDNNQFYMQGSRMVCNTSPKHKVIYNLEKLF